MRTVEAIIADLKHQIHWSQPNIRFNELTALVNELENTLSPSEVVVEEETIMSIIENPIEFTEPTEEDIKSFNESVASFLEIESIEEPVVEEPVVAKKEAKKK
jgi:hypothetical protein